MLSHLHKYKYCTMKTFKKFSNIFLTVIIVQTNDMVETLILYMCNDTLSSFLSQINADVDISAHLLISYIFSDAYI